jgi:hypothetical protein
MDDKNSPETGYRHDVSPYLLRPLRTFAEACRDIAERQQFLRRARLANDNAAVYPVVAGASLRRGGPSGSR